MKKYPTSAPINQHKRLATGQSLQKPNMTDKDPNDWGRGKSYQGRTNISSGDTGSVGTTNKVTKSPCPNY